MASARLTLFWLLALPVLVFTGFFLIPLGVVLVSSFTAPEAGLTWPITRGSCSTPTTGR